MTNFRDFSLHPATLAALDAAGHTTPTEAQQKAIPVILEGRDVVVAAQTGTGKTACYVLPILEMLTKTRARARMPRALILAPTREIALQVHETFDKYAMQHPFRWVLLMGGTSPVEQKQALAAGVDIVVATPGRLLDHLGAGRILTSDIKMLVIDEADRMLDMGFIPDIEKIIATLPVARQTALLSATMPPPIRKLADKYLNTPVEITITPKQITNTSITLYRVPAPDKPAIKRELLRELLKVRNIERAVIFCNRKIDVAYLAKSLARHGFSARELHGDISQSTRLETLEAFKAEKFQYLVASDVAARGIHIEALPAVINFDVPTHQDEFVHRVGRTGRAGHSGEAYTLVCPKENESIGQIEQMLHATFEVINIGTPIPSAASDAPHEKKSPAKYAEKRERPAPKKPFVKEVNQAEKVIPIKKTTPIEDDVSLPAFLFAPLK